MPMHDPPPKKRRFSQTSISFASESSSNSASSSSCSSSPSSSSASSSSIVWVDHSQNSKFDSPMWKLGLFLSSEKKINGTYKVKCVICEQHHVVPAPVWNYDGTTNFLYHAEKIHPKEPKVVEWLHQKSSVAEQKKEAKVAEEKHLGQVAFAFLVLAFANISMRIIFSFMIMMQVLKQASLETFVRNVAKEDARPLQPGQSQPQWKTSARQSIVITRAIAEMIIRDGRHPYMVEGEGLKRLLKILEPRYVLPSRPYFTQVVAT